MCASVPLFAFDTLWRHIRSFNYTLCVLQRPGHVSHSHTPGQLQCNDRVRIPILTIRIGDVSVSMVLAYWDELVRPLPLVHVRPSPCWTVNSVPLEGVNWSDGDNGTGAAFNLYRQPVELQTIIVSGEWLWMVWPIVIAINSMSKTILKTIGFPPLHVETFATIN